jgi:hypothetical protein
MSIAHSVEIGVLAGIALFFIFQRLGWIDKWFDSWDR